MYAFPCNTLWSTLVHVDPRRVRSVTETAIRGLVPYDMYAPPKESGELDSIQSDWNSKLDPQIDLNAQHQFSRSASVLWELHQHGTSVVIGLLFKILMHCHIVTLQLNRFQRTDRILIGTLIWAHKVTRTLNPKLRSLELALSLTLVGCALCFPPNITHTESRWMSTQICRTLSILFHVGWLGRWAENPMDMCPVFIAFEKLSKVRVAFGHTPLVVNM